MSLTTLILQIILTIPLTLLLQYCTKREYDRFIFPSVYILVLAALFPKLKENIFLIVIFEIFMRNFYINNLTEKHTIKSNILFICENLISIALSLFTYNYFISKVNVVLPSAEEIKPFLWFLVVVYLLSLINVKEVTLKREKKQKEINKEYIVMQYAKYKSLYKNSMKNTKKGIENVLYAIMIYENQTHSLFNRKVEEVMGMFTRKPVKYGIMRQESNVYLSDEDSIKIVAKKLEKRISEEGKIDFSKALKEYSNEEQQIIKEIYQEIVLF